MTTEKGGRPAAIITDEMRKQIRAMAGYGCTWDQISDLIGLSVPTLKRRASGDYRQGAATASVAVRQSLYRRALQGNVIACIFWLKCRDGWREEGGQIQVDALKSLRIPSAVLGRRSTDPEDAAAAAAKPVDAEVKP